MTTKSDLRGDEDRSHEILRAIRDMLGDDSSQLSDVVGQGNNIEASNVVDEILHELKSLAEKLQGHQPTATHSLRQPESDGSALVDAHAGTRTSPHKAGLGTSLTTDAVSARSKNLDTESTASSELPNRAMLGGALDHWAEQISKRVGAHQCVIHYCPDGDPATGAQAFSLSDKYHDCGATLSLPGWDAVVSILGRQPQGICLTDDQLANHPAWQRGTVMLQGQDGSDLPVHGMLVVPVIGPSRETVGVVQLTEKSEGEFTQEDLQAVTEAAQLMAPVFCLQHANEQLTKRNRELARDQQRIQATIESAPTAMVMIDRDGQMVLVNREAEQMFGYSRSQLLDEPVEMLVPERFRPQHAELRGGFFYQPETRRMGAGRDLFGVRKDGQEFPIEIGLNPIETDEGLFVLAAIVDITERKQLEDRLRKSNEGLELFNLKLQQASEELSREQKRIHATVESAPTAMVMIDGNGCIVLVNAEAEQIFGFRRNQLLGQPIEMLVPQRIRPQHVQLRSDFLVNPEARRMGAGRDLFGLREDGSEFPIEIGLNPVPTDDGVFVLAAIVDITERKRLEDRLRKSNEQLEASNLKLHQASEELSREQRRINATVESAPMAMVMIDQSGSMVLINAEAEHLFGYSRQKLLNHPVEILIPERFRGQHVGLRSGFFQNPEARRMGAGRDLFGLREDGSEFPIEIGLNPVKTDDGVFVLAAIVDITERKLLEERLRSSNEEFEASNIRLQQVSAELSREQKRIQATVESAPMAMVMINHEGLIVLVNTEAEHIFGYPRDQLLDQPVETLIPTRFRDQHVGMRDGFFAAPESRRMGAGRDLFGLRNDGSEFPIEIGLNPVRTDQGIFVLAAIVDTTERKRLEGDLRKTNEALELSNIELQQFAYVASHDLQTPLRHVANFTQFLQQDYQNKLDEQADQYIDRIVGGVKRMRQLISDLLAYSRVDSRAAPFKATCLNEVFDDALELLYGSIEDVSGEVTRDALPTVLGDRSQLLQLLQNLIGNGIKYHGEQQPRVHVSAEQDDRDWIIAIRDNGIGIAPENFDRIFEVFRRLHTQQAYPGTGIGLSVCRRIVHRHGGRIWLESDLGKGCTFYFRIVGA